MFRFGALRLIVTQTTRTGDKYHRGRCDGTNLAGIVTMLEEFGFMLDSCSADGIFCITEIVTYCKKENKMKKKSYENMVKKFPHLDFTCH